jgi:hypothetical protein
LNVSSGRNDLSRSCCSVCGLQHNLVALAVPLSSGPHVRVDDPTIHIPSFISVQQAAPTTISHASTLSLHLAMSGIEIAGLVLGAFPLLIQVLKTYREGAEALNDWWRIERAYKKTCQDLSYHQILFEGNVERFLLPLVADDDELLVLMADPAGGAWENVELEARLRQRLPKSYDLFLDIMGDISDLVDALKKELGVKEKFGALLTKVSSCIGGFRCQWRSTTNERT